MLMICLVTIGLSAHITNAKYLLGSGIGSGIGSGKGNVYNNSSNGLILKCFYP